MNLLFVEDDLNLSNDIRHQLLLEQFTVDVAYDGLLAERLILHNTYDCILLDVNIPGKNGFTLLKEIRNNGIATPVILITAYGELNDKLSGFENGADDYITKPFYFKELLARIRVFLKRTHQELPETNKITISDLVIDQRKKQVFRSDKLINLTPREYEILNILAEAEGEPVNKKELLKKVWGSAFEANTNTIEVFINMLRNKIDKGFDRKLIKTRIGYGYCITADE